MAERCILPIYFFIKVKPVFRCKQIDNKTFRTVNLKPENSKKKKNQTNKKQLSFFFFVWNYEHFFPSFSKLQAGGGGQPINFFFRPNPYWKVMFEEPTMIASIHFANAVDLGNSHWEMVSR